ncbi:MAG: type II toxin-antitoxin system VapC family toxin [Phycisphaerae bacterium]
MMTKPMLLYWDSCAFIHRFQETPQYVEPLREHIEQAKIGNCRIATSAITLAEVYKLPDMGILPVEVSNKILEFFRNDYIVVYQADRPVCEEAHHIQRLHSGLLPADAIHVATALSAKANVLITSDTKKYRRNGLLAHNLRIGNPPIKIEIPNAAMFHPLPGVGGG